MKITINGFLLDLREGDEVQVNHNWCDKCECSHEELTLKRGNNTIVRVGDVVILNREDELYGGVVLDKGGNPKVEHKWVAHIIPNGKRGMTEDKRHYIGYCGTVLTQEHPTKLDRIIFTSGIPFLETERLCPECKRVWEAEKKL